MTGVIYCRVSSKEQIEGTSLEVQEMGCREYARLKEIRILKAFVEQGESAKFADRTKLLELIDFCRANKGTVQVLLVWKVDRFARNVADHYSVKAALAKYGVRIVSVTEPIDANPEGKLMETILAGFAQFDNDIRATRTVQGMRRKIQDGIFPWRPPFGYKSSAARGDKKTVPDEPDQAIFAQLQKAWKAFATGAYRQLERRAGRGKHVPMITPHEFASVQRAMGVRNRAFKQQKERADFPLRGLVRCDGCLRRYTGAFSRGRSR